MTDSALHHDIGLLNELLERVVAEQTSVERCRGVQRLRRLARARRADVPGADTELAAEVAGLSLQELEDSIRALSLYFDLANLAEDLQRIRVLRQRELAAGSAIRPESIRDAIRKLQQQGVSAADVQLLLDRLHIELVFTAHPTEAKRRTTRRLIRQLRRYLGDLNRTDLTHPEREDIALRMSGTLTLLWQNDPLRPQPPTVLQEVERGLFFVDGLWEIVPRIQAAMRQAVAENYPGETFRVPPIVRFGSWIGGDRDGNPYVTAEITKRTLALLRRAALDRHLATCKHLEHSLVMSAKRTPVDPALLGALDAALNRWPRAQQICSETSEIEVYRRWLKVIEFRLQNTSLVTAPTEHDAGYRSAAELKADVRLLGQSLAHHNGGRIAETYLADWMDQIDVFGLQFATLDVRQDARVHDDVLAEILNRAGLCLNYKELDEAGRCQLLVSLPTWGLKFDEADFAEVTRDTLKLFRFLAETVRQHGMEPFGGHVISMTHHVSDVLAVLWLWRWGWRTVLDDATAEPPYLPIVPLFETIDDLRRGPEILGEMLALPEYRAYLQTNPTGVPTQMVMVGYSDSTKDGGYLAASWGLSRSQEQLARVAANHHVRLMVFHGRGGALGRGGGPAARAILSLPASSVQGAVRITEQGEVLAERYDDPRIALRHLEQVSWATLLISGLPTAAMPEAWSQLLDQFAQKSFERYRQLVQDPGFLKYFDQATPIGEIERLPIGSRPARRRERRSLADLRAIPWTFAWTQSRHFLPAWFGVGHAVHAAVNAGETSWETLQQMYETWPLFQAMVDNATLALSKADPWIGERYADQVDEVEVRDRIWTMIREEYRFSASAARMIAGEPELLAGTPWLQRSIQERNPYVDPLNLVQIELIRRRRQAEAQGDEATVDHLRQLLRLTIQGIAAGLRTTG